MRARHLLPLTLVGLAGLTACGSSDEPSSAPISAAPAATTPSDQQTTASTPPASPEATTAPPATEAPGATPATAPPVTDAPVAVPAALDFTAPLVGGGQIEMGSLAGKPVVLWFWAPF